MALEPGETQNVERVAVVVTTCLVFSIASFMVRIYLRLRTKKGFGWDDYWAALVMVFCIALSTSSYIGISIGFGAHALDLLRADVVRLRKGLYGFQLLWEISIFTAKSGFLLTCYAMFAKMWLRGAAVIVGVSSLCIFLASLFGLAFQCTPISKFWLHEEAGFCINHHELYFALTTFNILNNVAILSLPIPLLWNLGLSIKGKLWIGLLVILGSMACISGISQVWTIRQVVVHDSTFTSVPYVLSCTAEVQAMFILTNLSLVWPLNSTPTVLRRRSATCPVNDPRSSSRIPQAPRRALTRFSASSLYRLTSFASVHRNSGDPAASDKSPIKWQFSINLRSGKGQSPCEAINISRVVVCEVEDAEDGPVESARNNDKGFETRVMTEC